jgi:tRNA-dihydrouridine synthase
MGCPDRKVMKQGAGIALAKNPERVPEIIAAAKEGAGPLPVSIKTRLGLDKVDINWISKILECDIPALTVHLRTMKEMSKVSAHWEIMPEIAGLAKNKKTLIIGNGDIMSMKDVRERAKSCGADGVMIGRGIFTNPWFFNAHVDPEKITEKNRLALLMRHTEYFDETWGKLKNFNILKRFYKIYISGFDGAKELRMRLMEARTPKEVYAIVEPELERAGLAEISGSKIKI